MPFYVLHNSLYNVSESGSKVRFSRFRSALRADVIWRGAPKAPRLYPALFSYPLLWGVLPFCTLEASLTRVAEQKGKKKEFDLCTAIIHRALPRHWPHSLPHGVVLPFRVYMWAPLY